MDEAEQASETQSVAALMSLVRVNQEGRHHVVLVGDPAQLPPVYASRHHAVTFLTTHRRFRFGVKMNRQFISLFERLFNTERAVAIILTHHYRSHPDLAHCTLTHTYKDLLLHPLPRGQFETPFNNIAGEDGLQCLTIVDTRLSRDRYEGTGRNTPGRSPMVNNLELSIANDILFRIYKHRGCF